MFAKLHGVYHYVHQVMPHGGIRLGCKGLESSPSIDVDTQFKIWKKVGLVSLMQSTNTHK